MRDLLEPEVDRWRLRDARTLALYGSHGDEACGRFLVKGAGIGLLVVAAAGEQWAPVPGYEGLYEVSSGGAVRSLPKDVPIPNGGVRHHERAVLSTTAENGYPRVTLCRDGGREKPLVHVLVARAFIANPRGYPVVNHRDGDTGNASVLNLEWCTHEYNSHHAIENGLVRGPTVADIAEMRRLIGEGATDQEIAVAVDCSRKTVANTRKGWVRNLEPDPPTPYAGLDEFWDHVSVSAHEHGRARIPTWDEMEKIKRLFFADDETAIQLHVPPADHISFCDYSLHLWRPLYRAVPMPPKWMVAPGLETEEKRA